MAWVVLIISGLFEAVWATALGRSDGLTRLWPAVVFFVALAISMGGLAYAMKTLPTGTSYAVWVGIGATVAVVVSMAPGAEAFSWPRAFLLFGLVSCIALLKVVR
jgi:quaternary ammonium compound-resistance protein SugE